jgi:hypothetical protein
VTSNRAARSAFTLPLVAIGFTHLENRLRNRHLSDTGKGEPLGIVGAPNPWKDSDFSSSVLVAGKDVCIRQSAIGRGRPSSKPTSHEWLDNWFLNPLTGARTPVLARPVRCTTLGICPINSVAGVRKLG